MLYRCTECEELHLTFEEAAECHWGIGGVEEVDDRTDSEWAADIVAAWTEERE